MYISQRSGGIEYAAAAGTQDVPGQLENSNAGCVQERGDDALFVKAPFSRKIQDVDPAKLAIGAVADQRFHGGNHLRISGLPHYAEQALGSSFAQWIPVPKSLRPDRILAVFRPSLKTA